MRPPNFLSQNVFLVTSLCRPATKWFPLPNGPGPWPSEHIYGVRDMYNMYVGISASLFQSCLRAACPWPDRYVLRAYWCMAPACLANTVYSSRLINILRIIFRNIHLNCIYARLTFWGVQPGGPKPKSQRSVQRLHSTFQATHLGKNKLLDDVSFTWVRVQWTGTPQLNPHFNKPILPLVFHSRFISRSVKWVLSLCSSNRHTYTI